MHAEFWLAGWLAGWRAAANPAQMGWKCRGKVYESARALWKKAQRSTVRKNILNRTTSGCQRSYSMRYE